MPLFMDIHTVDSDDFSVEDVVKAHMKDLSVQEKFGVVQVKYWVDTDNKKIFCLMQGPDKAACNAVHLESHGNTACNIIEVSDDEYNLFLNNGKTKNDLAHTLSGKIDAGFRTFLTINIIDLTRKYNHYSNQIYQIIQQNNGTNITQVGNGFLVSFTDATSAVICAITIKRLLGSIPDNYEYRLALVTGDPVDVDGSNLFEETKSKIDILCKIGFINKIYIDDITKSILDKEPDAPKLNSETFKIIGISDYLLLKKIFKVFNEQVNNPDFNLEKINASLGLSKAQSYRKIKSVTGFAPGQLIQELRLRESIVVLNTNIKTISETAFDLGFNTPSYFTRAFKKRFKILPSFFIKLLKE